MISWTNEELANENIYIISGEGADTGFGEKYTGKCTNRAIKLRLTKERCGGDRWACAAVKVGDNFLDYETGDYVVVRKEM